MDKGCYSEDKISKALQDAEAYKAVNREQPGFFDVAINSGGKIRLYVLQCLCAFITEDSLSESYQRLKGLVMAYGGITPDSITSSRPPTQFTTASSGNSKQQSVLTCLMF